MAQKSAKTTSDAAKKKAPSKPNGNDRAATADELLDAYAAEQYEPPKPQGTIGRFVLDILVVTALLGGGIYYYKGYVETKEKVAKLSQKAADALEKDDLKALTKAETTFKEILDLQPENAYALAGIAETYFHLDRHGLKKLGEAEAYLKKAEAVDAKSPERYATSAYIKIKKGQADAAARDVTALLDQDLYSPKLAHALGWAMMEQGQFTRANQVLRQSIETDFNAVRFALTLTETADRQGRQRAAIRNLDKVLSRTMNPDHGIALGWSAALRAKSYGNLQKPAKYIDTLNKLEKRLSPAGKGYKAWAEGELALALQNAKGAAEKADEAKELWGGDHPHLLSLRARSLKAQGKADESLALLREAADMKPEYRGAKWELAHALTKLGNDEALDLVKGLEDTDKTTFGAEYELFRGEHYLKKGNLTEAKAAFTKAADLGNDAEILLGLARITFQDEKAKGKKADLEAVGDAFSRALQARAIFPELQEAMAGINLWNYQVPAANQAFTDAENQFKKLRRPVPELMEFFDRVIDVWKNAKDRPVKKEAKKMIKVWEQRKADYLASVASFSN